jgi:outer membrane protein assembly factor BamE
MERFQRPAATITTSYSLGNTRMSVILMKKPTFFLVAMSIFALSGCGTTQTLTDKVTTIVTPYRMDIVQGNVVTREQIAMVKPGTPRMAVRNILGTSLLVSVFHADRWDYVFSLERQGAEWQNRRVTVFFKNDVVDRVESDELPSETDFAATLKSKPIDEPLPPMEAAPNKLAQPPIKKADAPAASPGTLPLPPAVYPPLESVSQ